MRLVADHPTARVAEAVGRAGRLAALAAVVGLGGCIGGGDDGDPPPCEVGLPGTICGLAGQGNLGFNGDGHAALETDFYLLSQVRRGPDGRIWLMDHNNHMLRVIEDDGTVSTVSGSGWHGFAETGVPATESPMENPFDFDFDADGEPIIVSYHDPRVLRLDADGTLQLVAGIGFEGAGWPYPDGDGGPAIDALFLELGGVAVGPAGEIYVADLKDNRVRVIRDHRVYAFAGTGEEGYGGDGGPATAAKLSLPTGLAVGPDGSVYVADRGNDVVRRVAPDGTIETVAGVAGQPGFAGDGGPARAARLDEPDGLAISDAGVLYIADRENHRVREVALDGTIRTIAGTGELGFEGDGGPALEAALGRVARLSWSPGELFVADQSNSCARKILLED